METDKVVSLDFETIPGTFIAEIFSIGVKINNKFKAEACKVSEESVKKLFSIMDNCNFVVFHNAKFDLRVLEELGYDISSLRDKTHDTMIMAHLLDENRLNRLKVRCADVGMELTDWKKVNKEDDTEYLEYAKDDALATIKLYYKYKKMIANEGLEVAYLLEQRLIYPVMYMEKTGIYVDVEKSKRLSKMLEKSIDEIEEYIYILNEGWINLASTDELYKFLIGPGKIKWQKEWYTEKGKPSTNEKVLKSINTLYKNKEPQNKVIDLILKYRKYSKLHSTFVGEALLKNVDSNNRLHSNFNQVGTVGSRFSSSDINLQNISNASYLEDDPETGIRTQFIPTPGWKMAVLDYSQIEYRVTAILSQDATMIDIYKAGKDLHEETALSMNCERRQAKIYNFGIIYGMQAKSLGLQAGKTLEESIKFLEAHRKRFPKVYTMIDHIQKLAHRNGYVRTFSGRKRRLPDINSDEKWEVSRAERQAVNSVIQSAAGEIIKLAMVKIYDYFDQKKLRMVAQVHDELLIEYKSEKDLKKAKQIMENVVKFDDMDFPASGGKVSTWADKT